MSSVLFVLEGLRVVLQGLVGGSQLVLMRASCASHTANTLETGKPLVLVGDRDMEGWNLS